jgi:hypothetical protein
MKKLILMLLIFLSSVSYSQRISYQISPTYFYGSSVIIDDQTSFTNLRYESKLFNRSTSAGLSILLLKRDRYRYYQSKQFGVKISLLRSRSSQTIVYDPTLTSNLNDIKVVTDVYNFIEVPILFTQSATNHQIVIYEIGPVYSYLINDGSSNIGAMAKFGINNHLSNRLSYSFLFSSNNTFLKSKFRTANGLELNLIYRLSGK